MAYQLELGLAAAGKIKQTIDLTSLKTILARIVDATPAHKLGPLTPEACQRLSPMIREWRAEVTRLSRLYGVVAVNNAIDDQGLSPVYEQHTHGYHHVGAAPISLEDRRQPSTFRRASDILEEILPSL